MDYKPKQVIIMRTDLNMRKGKMIAQGAHASMMFLVKNLKKIYKPEPPYTFQCVDHLALPLVQFDWLFNDKFTKITLGCSSEEELLHLYELAKDKGLEVHKVEDEGLTEFHGVKTLTCIAIGPNYSNNIDPITKDLKLL